MEELRAAAGAGGANQSESQPRQTGSLEWRQQRGEMGTGGVMSQDSQMSVQSVP